MAHSSISWNDIIRQIPDQGHRGFPSQCSKYRTCGALLQFCPDSNGLDRGSLSSGQCRKILHFHSLVQGQFKNLTASHCKWTLPPLTRYSEVVLRTLFITVSCMIAFAISSLTASSLYSFAQVSVTGGLVSGPEQGLVHLNWWKSQKNIRSD